MATAGFIGTGGANSSATNLIAITPSDSVDLPTGVRGIYVGVAGNVAIQAVNDTLPQTFVGVAAGSILPVRAQRVFSTGTTATTMLGMI